MIPRILLFFVALLGVHQAMRGFQINQTFPDEPAEITVNQFQMLGDNAPAFIHIADVPPQYWVCLTETRKKGGEDFQTKRLYVSLVTAAQRSKINRGVATTIPTFVEYDSCDDEQKRAGRTSVRGVVKPMGSSGLGQEVTQAFRKYGVVVGDRPTVLHEQYAPTSEAGNSLILLVSILGFAASILPFFKREKWPDEDGLAHKDNAEVLSALYPALSVHDRADNESLNELARMVKDNTEERVILRINCEDSSKKPTLAVLTNRRFLLYRTKRQWFLSILKLVDALLDKVPFGGIAGMMLEPFGESYEVLVTPKHAVFRETMGYHDREIIAGTVPWHKVCDMSLGDIVAASRSIGIKKAFWPNRLKVEFTPRKLTAIFRIPPDFEIRPVAVRVAAVRLLELFKAEFPHLEYAVDSKSGNIEIELEHVRPEAISGHGAPTGGNPSKLVSTQV
jgi:hypothetical protein